MSWPLPLKLRRWRGTAAEGPTSRLGVTDPESGVKLGFVHEATGWLFLPGHESRRTEVRHRLAEMGVDVSGPPIHVIDTLQYLPETWLYPATRERVKVITCLDIDPTGHRLHGDGIFDPVNLGEYHQPFRALTLGHLPWRPFVVGHLQRLGAFGIDFDPPVVGLEITFKFDGSGPYPPQPDLPWTTRALGLASYGPPVAAEVVYGGPPPAWVTELEASAQQPSTDQSPPYSSRSVHGELTAAARSLLPGALADLVALETLPVSGTGDTGDRVPAGFYEDWTKPGRWSTPEWQYDGRGIKAPLTHEVYTPEVEQWLAEFRAYGNARETVAAAWARTEQPDLWGAADALRIKLAADSTNFNLLGYRPGVRTIDQTSTIECLASRLWRRDRKTRESIEFPAMPCLLCGTEFNPNLLDPADALALYGPARYCRHCCLKAWGLSEGNEGLTTELAEAGLSHLASVLGRPPTQTWYHHTIARTTSDGDRDALMLARMAMPSRYALQALEPSRSWTEWLQAAGVVGAVHRTSRGTVCTARDGHPCRSLMELAIDDFLFSRGIAHEPEPMWPWHPRLNASGGRRADWLLGDGTFVEAAGLVGEAGYDAKLNDKVQLAAKLEIPLIVIRPDDLGRLEDVLREQIPRPALR